MKDILSEYGHYIVKALGIGLLIIFLNRIAKIFKGEDGKFQVPEFCKFAAFLIFTSLAVFMIYVEAHRSHEWHLFDPLYIFIVFGSLLSVLHMDHVIVNLTRIFELIIKLRMKAPVVEDEKKPE
jgi:hypothetical protein